MDVINRYARIPNIVFNKSVYFYWNPESSTGFLVFFRVSEAIMQFWQFKKDQN